MLTPWDIAILRRFISRFFSRHMILPPPPFRVSASAERDDIHTESYGKTFIISAKNYNIGHMCRAYR